MHEALPRNKKLDLSFLAPYLVFCALGWLSRLLPALFVIFVLFGIAFPLAWAYRRRDWSRIGLTRQNLPAALGWGVAAGLLWALYTFLVFGSPATLPELWPIQMLLALPGWFLILSPFQEFFFRGWMQSRLRASLGSLWAVVVTSLAFTLWHFFPSLEGTATSSLPLSSATGIASIFVSGLLWGFLYERTNNLVAPWLAPRDWPASGLVPHWKQWFFPAVNS